MFGSPCCTLPLTVEIKARQRHLATVLKLDEMCHRQRFRPRRVEKNNKNLQFGREPNFYLRVSSFSLNVTVFLGAM